MVIPFSNTQLRVPKGFQNLLVGLSTEVLRSQPRNIHAFAADYFEKLLHRKGRMPSNSLPFARGHRGENFRLITRPFFDQTSNSDLEDTFFFFHPNSCRESKIASSGTN